MTRTSPPQVAFSSGELDPLLHNRFDYARYQTGLAQCRGFIPLPQGGITRQPGTLYQGQTLNNSAAVLVPFQFAADDAVVLEFTPGKMRVWRYGLLVMNGAGSAPYELATPYDAASIPRLKWVQSADVLYMVDGLRPVQRLARYALNNWTIGAQDFLSGPFAAQNLDRSKTITAAPIGIISNYVTLTANSAFWLAGHVNSLIMLRPTDQTGVPVWTSNTSYAPGDLVRVGERVYRQSGSTTKTSLQDAPVHEEGIYTYGNGLEWQFWADDIGIALITDVLSPTIVTATVLRSMPTGIFNSPTYRWSIGAWNNVNGYPSALEIYEQRLVVAGTNSDPRTVWFSATGHYADFTPGTDADSAFAYTLAGSGSVNRITNLARGRSGLHVFALGEEYSVRSENRGAPIGPTTAVFGLDGSFGTSAAAPIMPNGDPIVISRDGRRVLTVAYSLQDDANQVAIMSRHAQHLGAETFEQMVWQSSPEPMAWLRRGNGELAVMIYDRSEDVLGWARASVAGGFVENLAVTPDASGRADVVTLVVRRTIDGQTRRYIETLAPSYGNLTGEQSIADAVHLFAALQKPNTTAQSVFTLAHLVGQQVYAWTDQGDFGPFTVPAGGNVTLPVAVTRAVIGLFDDSHQVETLDLIAAAPDGSSKGRNVRIHSVAVAVHRTAQAEIAVLEINVPEADRQGQWAPILPLPVAASLTSAISGLVQIDLPSGNAKQQRLRLRPYAGAPVTITGIVPTINQAG